MVYYIKHKKTGELLDPLLGGFPTVGTALYRNRNVDRPSNWKIIKK